MSLLLAFDPGKRTGMAMFRFDTGEFLRKTWLPYDDLTITLANIETGIVSAIVAENYRQRPGVGQRGHTKGEAMKVIGQLESFAVRTKCPIILQEPQVRLIAAKWAGFQVKKSHMDDDVSAWLHGIYYLRQHGKYTTALERSRGN